MADSVKTQEAEETKKDAKKSTKKGTRKAGAKKTAGKGGAKKPESFEFQAETRKLLDIVIHSLYTNKEIFLRELISNASDALDRLRFEALTDDSLLGKDEKLEIRLEADPEARTLAISDNGIGMSREEVRANIGTIAKSGTQELIAKLKASDSNEAVAELIGQFGVGFYSAFMVADKVTVLTRRTGAEVATRWESTGDGSYTLADDHRFQRGTTVTLHLKAVDEEDGIEDYTDFHVLQRIVKRHSDFVSYPIVTTRERQEPKVDDKGEEIPGETQTVVEDQVLNSQKPIWTRSPSEVKDEEYAEFYKHISHDWNDPLDTLALRAEGRLEYRALLFIPSKAPFDLFRYEQQQGLRLYVRRVLIMDRCEELLPSYLRFVRGVVDSADLPLNISRETVQHDRHIAQMRKWLTRKVLDHLKKMLEDDRDKYLGFWKELGRVLKEGVGGDFENRDRLAPLLLFPSSADPEKLTTLGEYLERMPEEQETIYYLTGESRAAVESSPHLEAFRDKGYEVLYLTDPVDEWLSQSLTDYEEYKLQSVAKGAAELGTEEERKKKKEELDEKKEEYEGLLELLQKTLDEHVKEVRLSARLTASPACLVGGELDMSPQFERFMRQTEGLGAMPPQKRILELNPDHELLAKLKERYGKDEKDPVLADYAHLLHGYALLAEGSDLPDPAKYNRLVGELMLRGL